MSKYSQRLAQGAGVDEAMAEMLLNASPMHAIGKIDIPDRILLEPGKFEPGQLMKARTTLGAALLAGRHSPLLQMAAEIALSHHERWGRRLSAGSRREAIRLAGRIAALADVFDALALERPYKRAWRGADACASIR